MHHYTGSGLSNVWLVNGYTEHQTPYGLSVAIADLEGLHRIIGLEIVTQPSGPLLGEQVRFLRHELDLSQRTLAELLDIKEITVRKWEARYCPKGPAQKTLRLLYYAHVRGDEGVAHVMNLLRHRDQKSAIQSKFQFREIPDYGWKRESIAA